MQRNGYHPWNFNRQPKERLDVFPSQIIAPITYKIQCEHVIVRRCCSVPIVIVIVVSRVCYSISMLQDQENDTFR